jgi:hypothetical protein
MHIRNRTMRGGARRPAAGRSAIPGAELPEVIARRTHAIHHPGSIRPPMDVRIA